MRDPWRPFRAGEDPLALRYMTPEQVAGLLQRVRRQESRPARKAATARWNLDARQLTSGQVVAMRQDRADGVKLRRLARSYGVSLGTVSRIVSGQRYRDVGGPLSVRR